MVISNKHSSPYHVIISFDEERLNDSLYLGMMTQQNELKKDANIRFLQVQEALISHQKYWNADKFLERLSRRDEHAEPATFLFVNSFIIHNNLKATRVLMVWIDV